MITLELNIGRTLRFNLKSYRREKDLRNLWYSTHGEEPYLYKTVEIITDCNKKYVFRLSDITNCTFDVKIFKYDVPDRCPIFENSAIR